MGVIRSPRPTEVSNLKNDQYGALFDVQGMTAAGSLTVRLCGPGHHRQIAILSLLLDVDLW